MHFSHHGYFLIRTPRLPLPERRDFMGALNRLTVNEGSVENVLTDPSKAAFMSSVRIASPHLYDSMTAHPNGNHLFHNDRLRSAALRTLMRMSCRSTPYGLSATASLGLVAQQTEFVCAAENQVCMYTAPSGNCCNDLINVITSALKKSGALRVVVNPSLMAIRGRFRVIVRNKNGPTNFSFVEQAPEPWVCRIIDDLRGGAKSLSEIEFEFGAECPAYQNPADLLSEALELGLIVPELALPINEIDCLRFLRWYLLDRHSSHSELISMVDGLAALFQTIREPGDLLTGRYETVSRTIDGLVRDRIGGAFEVPRHRDYIAAEAVRPLLRCSLSEMGTRKLLDVVDGVTKRTTRLNPLYATVCREFYRRFGDEAVPLLVATDPKYGLRFDPKTLDQTSNPREIAGYESRLSEFLVSQLCDHGAKKTIDLSDFSPIDEGLALRERCLATGFVLAEMSRQGQQIEFSILSLGGLSGIELMSRAGLVDQDIRQAMQRSIDIAEAQRNGRFVEVHHIPSPSGWHTVIRPRLRSQSISFVGAFTDDNSVPISRLFVQLLHGELRLTDDSGCEIIPSVASPHDLFHGDNLPLYRLLALIARPYSLGFQWPRMFSRAPCLPRVHYRGTWLQPGQWSLAANERGLLQRTRHSEKPALIRQIMESRMVPSLVEVGFDDQFLPLSFSDDDCLAAVMPIVEDERSVIREAFCNRDRSIFGETLPLHSEILMPYSFGGFISSTPPYRSGKQWDYHYTIGSPSNEEWLYYKIYCSPLDADRNVIKGISELSEMMMDQGIISSWFYVRYADPDSHIRYRAKIYKGVQRSQIFAVIELCLNGLADRALIEKWDFTSYKPELFRYGGQECLSYCEEAFFADSHLASKILTENPTPEAETYEPTWTKSWILSVYLMRTASRMGFSQEKRDDLLRRWNRNYQSMIPASHTAKAMASKVFAATYSFIAAIQAGEKLPAFPRVVELIYRHDEMVALPLKKLTEAVAEGRSAKSAEDILESLFHMMANRLSAAWSRTDELIAVNIAFRFSDWEKRTHQKRAHKNESLK